MFNFFSKPSPIPTREQALPGRSQNIPVSTRHFVNGNQTVAPFPSETQIGMFGLGCFWGAEKKFWETPGVYSTSVGFAGGHTPNPTYQEVCTGMTGHNEVVQVIFNFRKIDYVSLLQLFWESHNPTQGMRQGNDRGTQYRSGIYTADTKQYEQAQDSRSHYQKRLAENDLPEITTEILDAPVFFYAEDYHQQYLAKNPHGYCGLGGTGIRYRHRA
ncbi:MAG: peptide-methionine (S)-S-oxide reductase MsrA [Pseudomonadota bacterium]|jgi:peptide-methionine (S)-S-oxide reductase|nr:peptide-methionine (S)-S-oxide reductase MsrA [Pseudomonadota bacterium]